MEYFVKRRQRFCIVKGNSNSALRPTSLRNDPHADLVLYFGAQYVHKAEKRENFKGRVESEAQYKQGVTPTQNKNRAKENNKSDTSALFNIRTPERNRDRKTKPTISNTNEG